MILFFLLFSIFITSIYILHVCIFIYKFAMCWCDSLALCYDSLIYKFVHFVEVMLVLFSVFFWPWRKRIVTKREAKKILKKFHTFLMGQFHNFEVSEISCSFICINIIPYLCCYVLCFVWSCVFSLITLEMIKYKIHKLQV